MKRVVLILLVLVSLLISMPVSAADLASVDRGAVLFDTALSGLMADLEITTNTREEVAVIIVQAGSETFDIDLESLSVPILQSNSQTNNITTSHLDQAIPNYIISNGNAYYDRAVNVGDADLFCFT